MNNTVTLVMADDVKVVVPDSLELITPYVLMEQQDWFEDEVKFLRHLLRPGQKVIDIGSNYGVYTLSMARTVGPSGKVWSFEPALSTSRMLAESIAVNGFSNVVLEQSALSKGSGTAQLALNPNSELNALVHGSSPPGMCETVPLVTLDECMERYDWQEISFVKIDAEGEEANILHGGNRFFSEMSPLVQYEVKAGSIVNMELVSQFAAFGYDSYRLVPGLNLLVPFDLRSQPDPYMLNLFCCKQDRAGLLAEQGCLLTGVTSATSDAGQINSILKEVKNRDAYGWRKTIAKLPYGSLLSGYWKKTMTNGSRQEVADALFCYAVSRDQGLTPKTRFIAMEQSLRLFSGLSNEPSSRLQLASLARVARDYGARANAVKALSQLYDAIVQNAQLNLREPFLAPCDRFDSLPTGPAVGNWVLAAVLEEMERLSAYSSYYTGVSVKQRLEVIRDLGYGSEEMLRRLEMIKKRFALVDHD